MAETAMATASIDGVTLEIIDGAAVSIGNLPNYRRDRRVLRRVSDGLFVQPGSGVLSGSPAVAPEEYKVQLFNGEALEWCSYRVPAGQKYRVRIYRSGTYTFWSWKDVPPEEEEDKEQVVMKDEVEEERYW
jgi:hypothetical protein